MVTSGHATGLEKTLYDLTRPLTPARICFPIVIEFDMFTLLRGSDTSLAT